MGAHYRVDRPQRMAGHTLTRHRAFITTHADQLITGVSPPIWVWENQQKLLGAWCHVATTYVDYWEGFGPETTEVSTGLVLISTLGCSREQSPHTEL